MAPRTARASGPTRAPTWPILTSPIFSSRDSKSTSAGTDRADRADQEREHGSLPAQVGRGEGALLDLGTAAHDVVDDVVDTSERASGRPLVRTASR